MNNLKETTIYKKAILSVIWITVFFLHIPSAKGENTDERSVMDHTRKEISHSMHIDNWDSVRDKSIDFLHKALKSQDDEYVADAYFCAGLGYMHTNSLDSARNNFRIALRIANKLENDSMTALYLHAMGILESQFKGHLLASQSYYLASLKKARQADFQLLESALYASLGDIASARSDTSGMNWSRLAMHTSKRINDRYGYANAHSLIARQSLLRGDINTARRHLDEAANLFMEYGDSGAKSVLNLLRADIYIAEGDLRNARICIGQSNRDTDNLHGANKLHWMLSKARLLQAEGSLRESTKVLLNALSTAESEDNHFYDGILYDMLADNSMAAGNKDETIKYLKLRNNLTDADVKAIDDILIRERDIMYDMQVQRQENILEHLKLKYQQRILLAACTALLFALIAIAGLVYYVRKKRQLYRSIVAQHSSSMEREKFLHDQIDQLNDKLSGKDREPAERPSQCDVIDNVKAEKFYMKLCRLMEEEKMYTSSQLSRESIAEHIGVKPLFISRIVRQVGNCSFTDFVNNYRIREAVKLLSDTSTDIPLVKDIASKAGFLSERSFFRVFKNSVGMTPSAFRSQILKMAGESDSHELNETE